MSTRILFAGILGVVVMFNWTSIAHMMLPLGETGIKEIPNESAVVAAMQSNMGDKTGLYIFPGPGVGENATRHEKQEAMKKAMDKLATEPSGRSEEHTSELQSRGHLVCRLLLEKKK